MPEKIIVNDSYYKHAANSYPLISGLPLPNYKDGVVTGVTFINCTLHADCRDVEFVDCVFENCYRQ